MSNCQSCKDCIIQPKAEPSHLQPYAFRVPTLDLGRDCACLDLDVPSFVACLLTNRFTSRLIEAAASRTDIPNQWRQPVWVEIEAVSVREKVPKRHKRH